MGSYVTIVNNTPDVWSCRLGTETTASTVANFIPIFGPLVTSFINEGLDIPGFHKIMPGEKYQWGKMSLPLLVQGTCVRAYDIADNTERMMTLYMRPIFSGPTVSSDHEYEMQSWIDAGYAETKDVNKTKNNPQPRVLEQNTAHAIQDHPASQNASQNATTDSSDD